jgi:hypothetical protein
MKGFIGVTAKEKEDILKQHIKPYDGYTVGNVNTNMYPLTVYDAARDKEGITVNNNGNPGVYRNHRINEEESVSAGFEVRNYAVELDTDTPVSNTDLSGETEVTKSVNEIAAKNLHYDEIDNAYEFDSEGPGDPNLGYNVYNDTLPSYDFDSKGPVDVYEDEQFEDFYFDDLIDDDENLQRKRDQIEESVKKTLDTFKKFKKYN